MLIPKKFVDPPSGLSIPIKDRVVGVCFSCVVEFPLYCLVSSLRSRW
jgi:hypothetical protein